MNKKVLLILLILLFFILGGLFIILYSNNANVIGPVDNPSQGDAGERVERTVPEVNLDRYKNQKVQKDQVPEGYLSVTDFFEDKVKDYLTDCRPSVYMLSEDMTEEELGERSAELYREVADLSGIEKDDESVEFYLGLMEKISDNNYCVFRAFQISGSRFIQYINIEGEFVNQEL